MVAHKAAGLSVGARRSCGDVAEGNRHFSKVCDSLLGAGICGTIQLRNNSGGRSGDIEAIRASVAIEDVKAMRSADVNIAAEVG